MGLTDKQIRFCQEYVSDFNATQAAIRAGYSKKTAASIGSENLIKPDIQDFIKNLVNPIEKQLGISRERVMQEIGRIAFSDIRKLYTVDGSLKAIRDMDDESAAVLASVESYEERVKGGTDEDMPLVGKTIKVKTYDKTKALEMLAKHFKIYTDAPLNIFDLSKLPVIFK